LESASFLLDVVWHPAPNSTFFRPNAPAWAASKTVEIVWVHEGKKTHSRWIWFLSFYMFIKQSQITVYTTPMNPVVIEIKQGIIEN